MAKILTSQQIYTYIYMPETTWWVPFRRQDVEKQMVRKKTKAKKGRRKKEEKTWKHETSPQICVFFWPFFTIKLGKMKFLDKRYPPGGFSPMCIYIYGLGLVLGPPLSRCFASLKKIPLKNSHLDTKSISPSCSPPFSKP